MKQVDHSRVCQAVMAKNIRNDIASLVAMHNLKKPLPIIVRKIYQSLVWKPHSFEDLLCATNVKKAHLTAALDFLKNKGIIVSYNFTTKCVLFRLVRTKPLRYGWNFPWLDLMMYEEDWEKPWKQVFKKTENYDEDNLDKRFVKLLKDLLFDPNLDLTEILDELKMTQVPLKVLKLHNQEPYCLECLKSERKFVRMILCEKSEEHCCPNCGVVQETLLTKRR